MHQQYRPAKGRANWATFFLAVYGAIAIASILSTIAEIGLLQRIDGGPPVTHVEIAASDRRQVILALLYPASFIAAAVAFLVWIRRVSANLSPLGVRGQRFSPGWAVGAWFVPIVGLFRPYQIMAEIWRGSRPESAPETPGARPHSPASPLLGIWWAAWLVSGWIGNFAIRFFFSANTVDELIRANLASIAAGGISLAALLLAVILVRRITANQDKKHALRQAMIAENAIAGGEAAESGPDAAARPPAATTPPAPPRASRCFRCGRELTAAEADTGICRRHRAG